MAGESACAPVPTAKSPSACPARSDPRTGTQRIGSALACVVGPTQVQPGCLSCRLFQNWQDPDEFLIEVKWEAVDGLMSHLRSDTYKHLLLLMELSPSPPVLQFYTVEEVRGLELVQQARDHPIEST